MTNQQHNRKESAVEFKDISMEAERIYRFSSGEPYVIPWPIRLYVAESGSHRVEDAAGQLHYIAPGFQAITITLKPGNQGWSF